VKEYFADLDYYFLCQSFSWVSANRSALLATQVSKNNNTSLQAYDYNHLIRLRLFASHLLAQLCELCNQVFSQIPVLIFAPLPTIYPKSYTKYCIT
jgi:hypothetical protein